MVEEPLAAAPLVADPWAAALVGAAADAVNAPLDRLVERKSRDAGAVGDPARSGPGGITSRGSPGTAEAGKDQRGAEDGGSGAGSSDENEAQVAPGKSLSITVAPESNEPTINGVPDVECEGGSSEVAVRPQRSMGQHAEAAADPKAEERREQDRSPPATKDEGTTEAATRARLRNEKEALEEGTFPGVLNIREWRHWWT